MTRKEKLYFLLQGYYNSQYNESSFCEQFVPIYSDNVYDDECSKEEHELFEVICRLAERYSPYEEDRSLSSYFVDEKTFKNIFMKEIERCPSVKNKIS